MKSYGDKCISFLALNFTQTVVCSHTNEKRRNIKKVQYKSVPHSSQLKRSDNA